jgi:methyl-accepting chemotaxis protein
MFKLQSIATRLIMSISLSVALSCGILGAFSLFQQRSLTRFALDQQLRLQYDSVIAAIDYEGRAALAVSSAIAALPQVRSAVAGNDREALLALLGGSRAALQAQGIPRMTFLKPPATVLLRVGEPKAFGDDVSARRTTVVS